MEKNKLVISFAAGSNVGKVREHNEDNFLFIVNDNEASLEDIHKPFLAGFDKVEVGEFGALFVVADGMGGHLAGEVASKIAVQRIKQFFTENQEQVKLIVQNKNRYEIKEFIRLAIIRAHEAIIAEQLQDYAKQNMGTTVVLAWIIQNELFIGWVGDSRLYIYLPDEKQKKLVQQTKDHSLLQDLIDRGVLKTQEDIDNFPEKNVITRTLGQNKHLRPDVKSFTLAKDDKILLCSDGLNTMLTDEEIEQILSQDKPAKDIVQDLIDAANEKGGHDNITVILIKVESVPEKVRFTDQEPVLTEEAQEQFNEYIDEEQDGYNRKWLYYFVLPVIGFVLAVLLGVYATQFFVKSKNYILKNDKNLVAFRKSIFANFYIGYLQSNINEDSNLILIQSILQDYDNKISDTIIKKFYKNLCYIRLDSIELIKNNTTEYDKLFIITGIGYLRDNELYTTENVIKPWLFINGGDSIYFDINLSFQYNPMKFYYTIISQQDTIKLILNKDILFSESSKYKEYDYFDNGIQYKILVITDIPKIIILNKINNKIKYKETRLLISSTSNYYVLGYPDVSNRNLFMPVDTISINENGCYKPLINKLDGSIVLNDSLKIIGYIYKDYVLAFK